jgi:biotin synthase
MTLTYQNRLDTLERMRQQRLKVCAGGIVGGGRDGATGVPT